MISSGSRRRMYPAPPAPALAPASTIASNSESVRPGMTGATISPTGMPALASAAMASSRRDGVAARGSMRRASLRSSVVTEMATCARPFSAIGASRSMSRVTRADLVTTLTG